MAKYVFDSNIFINLQRRQPLDVFPSLWVKIGELMDDGTIISSQEVYDEIMIGGDDLEKWAKENSVIRLELTVAKVLPSIGYSSAAGCQSHSFHAPRTHRRRKKEKFR